MQTERDRAEWYIKNYKNPLKEACADFARGTLANRRVLLCIINLLEDQDFRKFLEVRMED